MSELTQDDLLPVEPKDATDIPLSVHKAVLEATGSLMEKLYSQQADLTKSLVTMNRDYEREQNNGKGKPQAKMWFADPYNYLDTLGQGYRSNPAQITYETLRQATERDDVIAAILLTRINQIASFAQVQQNKFSVGFKVKLRGTETHRRVTDGEQDRMNRMQSFIEHTGVTPSLQRGNFEFFMRKLARDRLTYDQAVFEKVPTVGGGIHRIECGPSETIRIASPRTPHGRDPYGYDSRDIIRYAQIMNGSIVSDFTDDELAFLVANPRTSTRVYGYGFSEVEMLITTITSHMWAEQWNRNAFSQGSTTKGILNLTGNIPPLQFEAFKRQWATQVGGVGNAFKTPIMNSDQIQWIPLQLSNTEMGYQMWMEYLIKVACAIYQIDPSEINFDMRSAGMSQPMFMSTNEAQQKVSKDKGLQPLLRFFQNAINMHVVWPQDPTLEFVFAGLDAKTEEQNIQLRTSEVQNLLTINEARAKEGLPPLEGGDVILNPTYTGYLQQKKMMEQQGGGAGGPGGMPGGDQGQQGGGPPPQGAQDDQEGGQNGQDAPMAPPPYQSQFRGKPGKEEERGADNLREYAKNGGSSSSSDDASSDTAEHYRTLRRNDWESSIHSSLRNNNLMKAFDTIDLE